MKMWALHIVIWCTADMLRFEYCSFLEEDFTFTLLFRSSHLLSLGPSTIHHVKSWRTKAGGVCNFSIPPKSKMYIPQYFLCTALYTSWIYCRGCIYRGKSVQKIRHQLKGEWGVKVKSIACTTRRWVLPLAPNRGHTQGGGRVLKYWKVCSF